MSPQKLVTIDWIYRNLKKNSVLCFIDCVRKKRLQEDATNEELIDCCHIGHYLCTSPDVIDIIVEQLMANIKTANCYAVYETARQLDIPRLLECTLSHMTDSVSDLKTSGAWGDLTEELRDRITSIRSALASSINSSSRLYFSSMKEYIAIFAERVQYFRERLAGAEEQLEKNLKSMSNLTAQDTKEKVQRQRARLHALESALAEQRRIFLPEERTNGYDV